MGDESLGPGFDTGTLIQPTLRKLVCRWMESAGLHTLILPQVWEELTRRHPASKRYSPAQAWANLAECEDAPFRWVEWTDDQECVAEEIRSRFTQACFPLHAAFQIDTSSDAIIISQALTLGTDVLVRGDLNTIDHYEINMVVERALGPNIGFVLTLDDALQRAFRGGEEAHHLLLLALTTIAPPRPKAWGVDEAFADLGKLRTDMDGAGLRRTAIRLGTRWEQCRDLELALAEAQEFADRSNAMRFERMRATWHRDQTA